MLDRRVIAPCDNCLVDKCTVRHTIKDCALLLNNANKQSNVRVRAKLLCENQKISGEEEHGKELQNK